MKKNLQMSLKTKWFEMTKSGEKTEDYREINEYWFKRLVQIHKDIEASVFEETCEDLKNPTKHHASLRELMDYFAISFKQFDINTMTLGYPSKDDKERIIQFGHAGIEIREGREEWGAEPGKIYFVIKHGKRIS